jgi:hypothetical protein
MSDLASSQERRMEDSALRAEIRALNNNVARLTDVVDENTKQLARLAVIENDSTHHGQSLERAFGEIATTRKVLEEALKASDTKHREYDRWIYTVIGFVTAVCMFWTVAGYRLNAIIDDQIKAAAEMRLHIHDDKVTTPEQVREIERIMK